MDKFKKLFVKEKIVQKLERRMGSFENKCDVCGKEVNFHDYEWLCRACRDKLPKFIQRRIHWLVDYPEARCVLFTRAIEERS